MDSLKSDITIDPTRFMVDFITNETESTNAAVESLTAASPKWNVVGAGPYREMMDRGETVFPPPTYLPGAADIAIPSREEGREIPLRVYQPDNGISRGALMHVHGGGFVVSTHRNSDRSLQLWANACQVTAVSVGYRLAPEHPWPAALHDTLDAVTHLATHSPTLFGSPLRLVVGESAGGTLAAQAVLHLTQTLPDHTVSGVILPFGWFDLTNNLPSSVRGTRPIVINHDATLTFSDAYLPGTDIPDRRDPNKSPLYEDLARIARMRQGGLPKALLLCGTADPLLDDTLLMGVKWLATGSEAVIKIFPGAAHGFTMFPGYTPGEEARGMMVSFMNERLDH